MSDLFRNSPPHWRTVRLKQTITACFNGTWGEAPGGGLDDVICVRVADFDRLRLRADLSSPTWRSVPQGHRRGRMLERGDLLLEKSGGGEQQPVGAVALYDGDNPAVCSNFIARMRVAPGFDARYLCYLHAALYHLGVNRRSIKRTTGIQNLDSEAYLSEVVRVPPIEEQRYLAADLDRKTGLVDRLARNKQRLLELLIEKRDAWISHAVVAGVNPGAPRKVSGAPWLEPIPEHWCVTRFKFIRSGALLYGANEPATSDDRSAPRYIRITDFDDDGTLREETFQSLPEHLAERYLLQDGDVLLARSGATVGKAFRYRAEWGRACFAGYLVRLRPDRRKILPDYLHYYARSQAFRRQVRLSTVQSTIANVSAERYANFTIPLPPIEEQQSIVSFLDTRTHNLQSLIRAAQNQLVKLQEYHSALIVMAVIRGAQNESGNGGAVSAGAS